MLRYRLSMYNTGRNLVQLIMDNFYLKNYNMKNVPIIVGFMTLYAIFFQVAIYTGMDEDLIFTMFFLSHILVAYMVYVILKYGQPPNHTFDERFYDDIP